MPHQHKQHQQAHEHKVNDEKKENVENTEVPKEEELKKEKEVNPLEKKVVELEAKLKEYEDLLRRKMADFDNFRKRAQQEKEKLGEIVAEQVISDFLPIYDNVNRAILAAEQNKDLNAFLEGVISIENLFLTLFKKYSIEKIDSVGQEFDPKIHQALYMSEGDYVKNTVLEELEKAFMKKERLIRLGKVVVGTPKKKEETKPANEKQESTEKKD